MKMVNGKNIKVRIRSVETGKTIIVDNYKYINGFYWNYELIDQPIMKWNKIKDRQPPKDKPVDIKRNGSDVETNVHYHSEHSDPTHAIFRRDNQWFIGTYWKLHK